MRRALLLPWLALAACSSEPSAEGGITIALDIPNATLDPKGFTTVEVTLHEADGDIVRSASLGPNNSFDLGELDPTNAVWIEATLRNDSGASVGYGRTAGPADLVENATITIPVRRPIAYIAGLNYNSDGNPDTPDEDWFGLPATFSDLSAGTALDGSTLVATKPVLVISAGPSLFVVEQEAEDPSGVLIGPATLRPVSSGDHAESAPFGEAMTGAMQDGAGSDDGGTLVIATSEQLYFVDTAASAVRSIATGNFGRVALAGGGSRGLGGVAIKDRAATTGTCESTAELWSIASGGDGAVATMIATGGFTDVAADAGRTFYIDACKNELGEVTETGLKVLKSNLTQLGRPTALAVSNGQAWIGVEQEGVRQTTTNAGMPAIVSLLVTAIASADPPRVVFTEEVQQVVRATSFPGVQRRVDAFTAAIRHLEIGAGGDYVAATISGQHHATDYDAANFPEMDIDTDELRVFDATSGGLVQRYRSWCDGTINPDSFDIRGWACTTSAGQTEPKQVSREHTITSMTFLFGKK